MYADLVDSVWRARHERALRLGLNLAREYTPNGDLILTAVGLAESYLGHATEATKRYRAAIRSQDSPEVIASTMCRLAHTLSCMGHVAAARVALADSRVRYVTARHPLLYARLHATQGAVLHRSGYAERALRHYRVAAAALLSADCASGRAHVQVDMALAYTDVGNYGNALWLAEYAGNAFERLDSPTGTANACNVRAVALMRKGRLDDAERVCRSALERVTASAPRLLSVLLGTLGEIQSRQGKIQSAAETLAGAIISAESVPMVTVTVAEMHLHLGFALSALGYAQAAQTEWSRACEILLVLRNEELLKQYRERIEAANGSLVNDLTRIGDRARAISGAIALERLFS